MVEKYKILLKSFVKVLHKKDNSNAFAYLKTIFPNLSDAKIKEGVFVGPQIKKLLNDSKFRTLLSEDEAKPWDSFCLVVTCFLGNYKCENYKEVIKDLLENYNKIGITF